MVPVAVKTPAPHALYVKRENIERWGAFSGCLACAQIVRAVKGTDKGGTAERRQLARLEQHVTKRARDEEETGTVPLGDERAFIVWKALSQFREIYPELKNERLYQSNSRWRLDDMVADLEIYRSRESSGP
eukprot:1661356-Amphidinium_carterae.1